MMALRGSKGGIWAAEMGKVGIKKLKKNDQKMGK